MPILPAENAERSGIEKAQLDELLVQASFITSYMPLTDATCVIIPAASLYKIMVVGDRYP